MKWLRYWWSTIWLWLNRVEPTYTTVTTGSRDRSLRGKARVRARRQR